VASVTRWDWSEDLGPTTAGRYPAIFLNQRGENLKTLSVFCDESGVFGSYESHSPYYIVTLLFHDQSVDIADSIGVFTRKLYDLGFPECTVHSGPLIRRENEFFHLPLLERKRIFNVIYNFSRTTDIKYHSFVVEKKQLAGDMDLVVKLTKQLSAFLREHMEELMNFERKVVYYDYGQKELATILISAFSAVLGDVEFKKVAPADYMLFQAADMLCTLELLSVKAARKSLSKSEKAVFDSAN